LPLHEPPKEVIAGGFQIQSGSNKTLENLPAITSQSLIEKWPEHQLTENKAGVMKFKLGRLLFKWSKTSYITNVGT